MGRSTRCWFVFSVLGALAGGLLFLNGAQAQAGDWPVWRGPSGNNIAAPGQNLPDRISETDNVLWVVPVPGRGHSSPTVVGHQIFLTTADDEEQVQAVLSYHRETGELLWKCVVNRGGFPKIHRANTHASHSVACNGTELFAQFENHGRMQLAVLSLDGKLKREMSVEPFSPERYQFGTGSSPALYKGLVFVAAEYEEGQLVAFDQKTGEKVWSIPRTNVSFSSPIVKHLNGRDQLLISGWRKIHSLDPLTGQELWSVPGTAASTCGTVASFGNLVFASGGFPEAHTMAVRVGESPEILWSHKERLYEQSLLASNGYVYGVNDNGILFCWRASDGEEMWKTRFCSKNSASPVLADGVIYHIDERGQFVAFRDNPEEFDKIYSTKLGDEGYATPTICGGRMYCRVASYLDDKRVELLYCFGKTDVASRSDK